jgi:predicted HicB family RNase H-like nuclease
MIKKVTTFQLPEDLKRQVVSASVAKQISMSEFLTETVSHILRFKKEVPIPKLSRQHEALIYTSVLIPESILDQARFKAYQNKVSLGDFFRYCLQESVQCPSAANRVRIKRPATAAA